ncbi:MAG: hypothetical protein M3540_07765 [Actinomycetota bacterium]|nr:hypothetical protein [Actinomycetota bacterium]
MLRAILPATIALALALALIAPLPGDRSADAAPVGAGSSRVDYYITGKVLSRISGRNRARVELRWDFKCLGDRLGAATFEWSLKVVRRQPKPEQTVQIRTGTTKTGAFRSSLGPGLYEPLAEPFRCETDRGAGSTTPEVGRSFVVPDYCAWIVATPRGQVQIEQPRAVKTAKAGDTVRPGDVVVARARSSLALRSGGGESALKVGAASRLAVDPRYCGRQGGWKLDLASGTLAAQVKPSADALSRYEVRTPNATAIGGRARWTVRTERAAGTVTTHVRVTAGSVRVANRGGGKTVLVRTGKSVRVAGTSPPR